MDENTQILDVTYGNFSCRLEGFEDSVETMKSVVAYFHDLAGHDRFMDVEPQAPDMATLALLAQEQTGMPVDVEGDGTRVSLRLRKDAVEDDLSEDITALDDEISEDADEEDIVEAEAEAPEIVEDEAEAQDVLAQQADLDADVSAEDDAVEDDPKTDDPSEDDFDVDASVSDKLQRIRAVVDGGTETDSDEYAEDLSDDASDAPAANPLTQRLAGLASRGADNFDLSTDDETDADATSATGQEDDLDKLRNVFDEMPIDDAEEDDDDDVSADQISDTDDLAAFENDADAEEDLAAELDALDDIEEAADVEMADDDASEDDASDTDDEAAVTADEATDDAEEETPAAKYRSPLVLTAADAVLHTEHPQEDDDFNLQEEVAKVEAEIAARQGNEVARHGLPRSVEDAMSRIMSQTDQHLNQPESRRHRDAFAQLKAAVAATEAARQLGDKVETRDPDADFKDDLGEHDAQAEEAEVNDQVKTDSPLKLVRSRPIEKEITTEETDDVAKEPVAPKVASTKTRIIEVPEEPAKKEPALEAPKAAQPMDAASERLRQIAALKETEGAAKTTGFAEFAAAHGATDLVDRLEAAGAYICFVEGNADFSRPQVMKVVQSSTDEEITREDGLRCFGRLLRQARLVKLSNGRFQVSDNTQYRPDGDQAAQG